MKSFICLAAVICLSVSAGATLIEVGDGDNSATVSIEWGDGYIAEFLVSFTAETVTGYDLMAAIDNEVEGMTIAMTNWGEPEAPNYFMDGIAYGAHSNMVYLGGDNWWHQWSKDAGGEWQFGAGMSGTIISDGDSEGWVYGRAEAPVPEPATMVLLALGGMLIRRKKA